MVDREQLETLIREVLDDTELKLKVDRFTLDENLENGQVRLSCQVHDARTGERAAIDGTGVGLVDAFFHGLVNLYAPRYPSLKTLRFLDFGIKAKAGTGRHHTASDMEAHVTLSIANSEGQEFLFQHASHSITGSSLTVVALGVTFFINSERAYVAVYQALEHARLEKRADSVQSYTAKLAVLVEATSYSAVIAKLKLDKPEKINKREN